MGVKGSSYGGRGRGRECWREVLTAGDIGGVGVTYVGALECLFYFHFSFYSLDLDQLIG